MKLKPGVGVIYVIRPGRIGTFLHLLGPPHGAMMSQKNCAKLFLIQLRQISTNVDNFWQKYGKEAEIMQGALIFHLT